MYKKQALLPDKGHKTVLLDPDKVSGPGDVPEAAMAYLDSKGVQLSTTEVSLDHTNFAPRTMLKKVLRETEEDVRMPPPRPSLNLNLGQG